MNDQISNIVAAIIVALLGWVGYSVHTATGEVTRLATMVDVMRAEIVSIRTAQATDIPELRERVVRIETKVFGVK
ncbi:MAG TPA: hypothetical protein VD860_18840 [Azospirillum sp.]|nr:hypothetical protein [Azospirillum sp.]